MAKFTGETRRRLATGWDPRVSTLRQYAKDNGVSERAIRNWRARLRHDGGIAVPGGNAPVPLQAVVNTLQQRLAELEAAVDAALVAADAARATLHAVAAHGDLPGSTEAAGNAPATDARPLAPVPMPRPGLTWF